MKKLLIFVGLLLLVSCVGKVTELEQQSSSARNNTTFDPENTKIIWTSGINTGLDVLVSSDFADSTEVDAMMDVWNDSTNSYTFFKTPATTTTNKSYSNLSDYNDGEMGVYKITSWYSGVSPFALAITQFFGVRRNVGTSDEYLELIHADIMFNYENYGTSFDNGTYDFQSVALHELGHFIGFQHYTGGATVMYPSLATNTQKRSLYTYDVNKVYENYNVSSLVANSSIGSFSTIDREPASAEGNTVQGIIELRADGKCHHYLNGKVVHVH